MKRNQNQQHRYQTKQMNQLFKKHLSVSTSHSIDNKVIMFTTLVESTVVKTSVGQPTTLVIGLPDIQLPEITWKKDGEPVNHPVLPDGSLYIINTDHTDEGEYTVIINRKESTAFENLQLTVINPQLPSG